MKRALHEIRELAWLVGTMLMISAASIGLAAVMAIAVTTYQ